jgi:hypothetical protein
VIPHSDLNHLEPLSGRALEYMLQQKYALLISVDQRDEDDLHVENQLCQVCNAVEVQVGTCIENVEPDRGHEKSRPRNSTVIKRM